MTEKKALSLKNSSIDELLGAGALSSLNINSISQLLLYPPVDYVDYSVVSTKIQYVPEEAFVTLKVKVSSRPQDGRVPHSIYFYVIDENGVSASVMAFGYQFRMLKPDNHVHLRCKVTVYNSQLQLASVQLIPQSYLGRIIPTYRAKKGIGSNDVFDMVVAASDSIKQVSGDILTGLDISELVLFEKIKSTNYQSICDIICAMHFPNSAGHGWSAIKILRKISAYEVMKSIAGTKVKLVNTNSVINIKQNDVDMVISKLPFTLTVHQQNAIKDVVDDLSSHNAMNRLLSGDVGHGKSAVIQATAIAANAAGARVAVMTCNLPLVEQLAEGFNAIDGFIPILKITGSDKLSVIKGNPIIIGTTAILAKLKRLGWVPDYLVVDEQEKFSRQQREELCAGHTNVLEATATCIPRTGALITHGVMDVSVLNMCPVEKNIQTVIVGQHQKRQLFDAIKHRIANGDQAAVVYPIVDKKDDADYKRSVGDMYAAWNNVFKDRVGLLHGRLSDDEKLSTIARMKNKEFDLLVSSTVIERGITMPSLKTLLVVDAEIYGLSTLHQIRGRLARHGGDGILYLLTGKNVKQESIDRLKLLVAHADGFTLSEMDMNMRGYGDMNDDSEKQHGKSSSRIFTHVKLMPKDFDGIEV